jgi:hypothetical protein
VDLAERVITAVKRGPAVRSIALVGSRAEGRAGELSDWDFRVETDDFETLKAALPGLVVPLEPLAQQWDRFSAEWCFMLLLRGPAKVDFIFPDEPHAMEPPWRPTRDNLAAIDTHFWDWVLWLASKQAASKDEQVAGELEKLFEHLLRPLGAGDPPTSVADAVASYREARDRAERRLGVTVPRELENEVAPALSLR